MQVLKIFLIKKNSETQMLGMCYWLHFSIKINKDNDYKNVLLKVKNLI